MNVLQPPLSRVVALALLVAVLFGLYLGLVQPILMRFQEFDNQISHSVDLLASYRRLGSGRKALESRMGELKQEQSSRAGFLKGENVALVGADLQNKLKTLVVEARGSLRSMQTLPPKEEGSFRRVAVRAQATLSSDALRVVLYGIDTATPYLLVDNLDIRQQSRRRRTRSRSKRGAKSPVETGLLFVSMDVLGYMRRQGE